MKINNFSVLSFLLMSVFGYAQVGIGTAEPEASLHIEGNVAIRELDDANIENDKQLFWNPETGEIEVVREKTYPIFIVTYKVAANSYRDNIFEQSRDYIKQFDTGIPTDRFEAVLLTAYPTFNFQGANNYSYYNLGNASNPSGEGGYSNRLGIRHINGNNKIINGDKFVSFDDVDINKIYRDSDAGYIDPLSKIACYKGAKNWEITADYVHASPPENGTSYGNSWDTWSYYVVFVWHFELLVIDKGYSIIIDKDAEVINGDVKNTKGGFDKNPLEN